MRLQPVVQGLYELNKRSLPVLLSFRLLSISKISARGSGRLDSTLGSCLTAGRRGSEGCCLIFEGEIGWTAGIRFLLLVSAGGERTRSEWPFCLGLVIGGSFLFEAVGRFKWDWRGGWDEGRVHLPFSINGSAVGRIGVSTLNVRLCIVLAQVNVHYNHQSH